MGYFIAILGLLLPVIVLVLPSVLTSLAPRCKECGQRGLKCVGGAKATIVVDGKRAPDSWLDYRCPKCDALFRKHRGVWTRIVNDLPPYAAGE